MMGGIALHEGDIAEMKTGEGKTFVASLPMYLNALEGPRRPSRDRERLSRHSATPNGTEESLSGSASRVSAIENNMPFAERKAAYDADITYGTNSEFGFDYLRDNMSISLDGVVQRGHRYAIVDEVDSILIDEARTPLIISGEPTTAAKTYYDFARVVKALDGAQSKGTKLEDEVLAAEHDFLYDEKHKTVSPTESGIEKVERALRVDNLYSPGNVQLVNHLIQSLKAQALYKRDVDYVIQDGEVKIVDEFTGRIMEGRRWSEGLHQAIEAKENVPIQEEHQTLATITLQNYFRLYEKLAGMTGTAKTEEKEFVEIYGLNVVEIPTNVAVARDDQNDLIFKTVEAKFDAVVDDVKERHEKGQPVLVGTIAVETSEYLSELLKRQGVPHTVLNAKEHAREAEIIKDAGQPWVGDDRHEHGGPRRRHQDRRRGARRSAACTFSAPSATRRAGSTTSCAAAPAARATPARRASTSRAATTSSVCSRATGSTGSWSASSFRTTSRWRPASSRARSRTRRRRSRSRTSSHARTSSSTTT